LPDSPDEVLKLTLRYLDPDPSVWVDPHLALSPYETHPMTELPEPGVLARAVLPQARPTAADGDLSSTSPSPGSSMARIPVTVQESSPGASGELTMPFILPGAARPPPPGRAPRTCCARTSPSLYSPGSCVPAARPPSDHARI
jgi:hypothetical protein